ncbi:MAG: glycoside hydrolase family 3 protein [Chakrabartia sp.]
MTKLTSRFGYLTLALALASVVTDVSAKDRGAVPLNEWPTILSPVKRDDAMETRIAAIVAGMTLAQKVGQMTQAEIRSITPDEARKYYIGSILNGGGAWPGMKKHATIADWSALSEQFYRASMSTDMTTQIPIIWGTDAVHGHNNLFGTVLFPHNIGLGAARDRILVGKIANATAGAVRATGITWVFAPTLAVVQNPRWGRTYESYSSDPQLVRDYAKAYVEGLQGNEMSVGEVMRDNHALASAKHFIGDGGTYQGKDQGENRANLHDLINVHGAGYFGALEAGVQTVMISYSSWNDVAAAKDHGKMHGNKALITDALKGKMGFDGLVVSDWNAIEQVPGCARAHCPQAINAGIDLVMVPDDWKQFIAETIKDVETGAIPMSRIDDAVTRIVRVKMRSGLYAKSPILPAAKPAAPNAYNNDRDLAREAVRKSLVLLKNNSKALPLKRSSRILVIGEGADRIERQTGGWSMTWQGTENEAADFPNATTLLAAIRKTATGAVDYSADGKNIDVAKYDAVIAIASETPYAEMRGDVAYPASLQHSARYPADLAVLKALSGKGIPVITVLLSGRPTYVNDLINLSDAFVAAWLPGTEGEGITDGLFLNQQGKYAQDFQGRLPFNWPSTACPGEKGTSILFARGYGLTYAKPRKVGRLSQAAAPNGCATDKK